jgi:hypothetical protein
VLIDKRHSSDVIDVRSYRRLHRDIHHHITDHYLVGAKIRARISNVMKNKGSILRRYDIEKLKNPQIFSVYRQTLNKIINDYGDCDKNWDHLCGAINESASEVLGDRESKRKTWFDEECEQIMHEIHNVRLLRNTRRSKELLHGLLLRRRSMFRKRRGTF